ncbi:MAG: HAD-IIIA family hydrolase [Candidatus Eremiobacteraeota bacterium]|nr:HAD-IIIA family hydrolase [Candidatus Eremiobacteraeota bacterium]
MNKAIFIDRDGTINKEVDFLSQVEDIEIIPRCVDAIKLMNENGFLVIIISNQSGIARGYFDNLDSLNIFSEIISRLKEKGASIDNFYYCPHHPEGKVKEFSIKCDCRKPAPGMFLEAREDFNIDFSQSFAIGDRIRDIMPAIQLGCKGILVKTGYGGKEMSKKDEWTLTPDFIAEDLYDAAKWILK